MSYTKNTWVDQEVERPRTYSVTTNSDETITLADSFGTVTELGTSVNAVNMNHIEQGIYECDQELLNKTDLDLSNISSTGKQITIKPGFMIYFPGDTAPDGFLISNGAEVSRTGFANLFKEIGTKFGSGDGSTTFNLPNLINRYIKGNTTVGTYGSASSVTGSVSTSGTTSWVGDHTHNSWQYIGDWTASSGAGGHNHTVTCTGNYTYSKGVDDVTMLPCIKY